MDVDLINEALFSHAIDPATLFFRLRALAIAPFKFPVSFGLTILPEEPGIILIRGARQYGKSTWLEQQALSSVQKFGPGSTAYLNSDELTDSEDLLARIKVLIAAMRTDVCRRLFIDEITAVDKWERARKIAADSGVIRDVLVVTTGSRATDIRRGEERLPGRKGKLARTNYIFTPVSFVDFKATVGKQFRPLPTQKIPALQNDASGQPLSELAIIYLLSGGSPVALSELLLKGEIPEWVIAMTRDWIVGEFSRTGRNRSSLLALIEKIYKQAMNPVGYTQLARDSGLANNTIVAEYIELLTDLMSVAPCFAWDQHKRVLIRRKPAKFHFINLLAAVSFSPMRLRTVNQFRALSPVQQSPWLEWLVAQELWRRRALIGEEQPELLAYWQTKEHEIDFVNCSSVTNRDELWEVKRGAVSALEFSWFKQNFPGNRLTVVSSAKFNAPQIEGISFDSFLERR